MKKLISVALCMVWMACGPAVNGTWKGPPLVTLGGQLTLKEGLTVGSGVRLAIAWYPNLAGDNPTPPRAIATEEVAYSGTFPQNFTFRLYGPPAQAALEVVRSEDGSEGEAAVGQLLAYEDLDGDGQLSVTTAGTSPDRILGSTAGAGPFDFFSSEQRDLVAWVKRADDLGLASAGMVPGYNLLRATSPFLAPQVLPLDTPIPLRMTGDPRLAIIVCPEAYANPDAEVACGVRVWATPAVNGSISLREDGGLDAFVLVQSQGVTTGAALVTVNGVPLPLDSSGLAYSLSEQAPSVLRIGRNTVSVELAGYSPLLLEATVPARFEVTAPASGARVAPGAPLQVSWTAAAGATQYGASLFVDGPGAPSDTVITSTLGATVVAPSISGPGEVSVTAWDHLTFARAALTGMSVRTVPVSVGN
ncbi:MAG: hypothetical protein Q8L48_00270 [Archangium sp.]|nr:hypothetical protein [Archangium sp.]